MGNFDKRGKRQGGGSNRGFSGGKNFGGRKSFGDRDGGRPAMFRAVCSECGDSCEVPFRPTGDKPVYCNSCFRGQDNGGGRGNRFGGERREKPRFRDKQMYDAVCDKCGKDCQVPFRPTGDKPIFCNNCFGKGEKSGSGSKVSGETEKQIKILSAKIDELIKILTLNAPAEKTEKKEKVEKKEKTKTKVAVKKVSGKKKK